MHKLLVLGYAAQVVLQLSWARIPQNDPSALSLCGNVAIWLRHNRRPDESKNFTSILGHVVYGFMACLMHHRLFPKMLHTFQTLLGCVKWCSELNLDRGPWIGRVWRRGLLFGDRHLPRLITFYSTWQTAVAQMLCLIYAFFRSFSLLFTVLATSGFPLPVVCTIPPWLLSLSF